MENLLNQLNHFDLLVRYEALTKLATLGTKFNPSVNVNLHIHSFFSYNAEGWSPSRIAWESHTQGLYATGIIDFDVLDGQTEFYESCQLLGLRSSVGIETRTFVHALSDKVIDSPGEPGVSYVAGAGFARSIDPKSPQGETLARFRSTADIRNKELIARINTKVPDIAIDYETDVLPLTPSGNATERHIMGAYIRKAAVIFSCPERLTAFWSGIFEKPEYEVQAWISAHGTLENQVRNKFAKKGGYGYVQPGKDTFPPVKEFFDWVSSCGAIPMESWLDGTSEGEKHPTALLELSADNGARALNLIPDRNWNLTNPSEKALKIGNLRRIIATADKMGFPLQIGTEMNRKGLPFADNLKHPDLQEFAPLFVKGAEIITGHVVAEKYSQSGYVSQWAEAEFGNNNAKRNEFFRQIGKLSACTRAQSEELLAIGKEKAFLAMADAAKSGKWKL